MSVHSELLLCKGGFLSDVLMFSTDDNLQNVLHFIFLFQNCQERELTSAKIYLLQCNVAEHLKLFKIRSPLAAKAILKHGGSINTSGLEGGFLNTDTLFYSQFLLMRTTRMIPCGSQIMTIWRTCMECLKRSTVSLDCLAVMDTLLETSKSLSASESGFIAKQKIICSCKKLLRTNSLHGFTFANAFPWINLCKQFVFLTHLFIPCYFSQVTLLYRCALKLLLMNVNITNTYFK